MLLAAVLEKTELGRLNLSTVEQRSSDRDITHVYFDGFV